MTLTLVGEVQSAEKLRPGMVNTVLGPVSAQKLGTTLMHEHFTFAYPGWFADVTMYPENWRAAYQTNLGVIKTAKACGIKTIVDATPNDTGGRNPNLYKRLAKVTGINIICSTGLYTEHEGVAGLLEDTDGLWDGHHPPHRGNVDQGNYAGDRQDGG